MIATLATILGLLLNPAPVDCEGTGTHVDLWLRALYASPTDTNVEAAEDLLELYRARCPR